MMHITFLVLLFCCFPSNGYADGDNIDDFLANTAKVDELFLLDSETLPYQQVVTLSRKVIQNRKFYSNNTLAKVFDILADTAINKGDLARAMQFALDGEGLIAIDPSLRLSLLLKIASGHYYKGQYQQAKIIANQTVKIAKEINDPQYLINALSYRAMTNALIAEHQLALSDLQQVRELLDEYLEFTDHIELLDVLASAHFYLGAYKTAEELYNKILKIRFDLSKKQNIEQTYYHLARSYLKLSRLDDAYNAFWQAKMHAEVKDAPIRIAYAQLGLGQVLFQQQNYLQALVFLQKSELNFHGQNLAQPHLTALLNLAKVTRMQGDIPASYQYLKKAENMVQNTELTEEQIEYYLLLAEMHQDQQQYKKAHRAQGQYLALYKQFNQSKQNISNELTSNTASELSRKISLQMAEETALKNQFLKKYQQQEIVIALLAFAVILILVVLIFVSYRTRIARLNQQYDEVEKPADYMANPSQTKRFYQQHYKMARKYDYPFAVGYFSINNWQELTFKFSQKVVDEVGKTIATLVNECRGEFHQVGLINEGEYLFLAPHQDPDQLKGLFEQLTKALKVQFFANLGEFSIKVSYDYQSPHIQDIDPYIFLSRLSESTRAEYSSYKI